ncbi:MAG: hypothetical protein RLZZ156_2304 [Deinococcota bacterium]|jgi:hypothetical protein
MKLRVSYRDILDTFHDEQQLTNLPDWNIETIKKSQRSPQTSQYSRLLLLLELK